MCGKPTLNPKKQLGVETKLFEGDEQSVHEDTWMELSVATTKQAVVMVNRCKKGVSKETERFGLTDEQQALRSQSLVKISHELVLQGHLHVDQ